MSLLYSSINIFFISIIVTGSDIKLLTMVRATSKEHSAVSDENNLSITHLIMNKDYYLTVLDILLLSNKYDIPIALLSSKHFKENNKEIMTLNTNKNEVFIIIVPLFYENMNNFPKYKMIIDKDMDGFIEIRNLPPSSIKTEIVEQKNSLENLIQNYTIEKQPLPITKKVKKLKLVE